MPGPVIDECRASCRIHLRSPAIASIGLQDSQFKPARTGRLGIADVGVTPCEVSVDVHHRLIHVHHFRALRARRYGSLWPIPFADNGIRIDLAHGDARLLVTLSIRFSRNPVIVDIDRVGSFGMGGWQQL